MNDRMYRHPAVQENIKRLAAFGYRLIGPVEGDLACGRRGTGHLADVADIVAAIEESVS
jgi:phosphopantothenoylcysteine decarboxylase/phosphopantothenate--cysteine ligase